MVKACIFDLDGVIVDTAKYHFLAWQRLAHQLGIPFTEEENEQLKGVSRKESSEYILRLGKVTLSDHEKETLANQKNNWYVAMISKMERSELLPGVIDLLDDLKAKHVPIALGSASKNAITILQAMEILHYFDCISDGNSTPKSKPDPEVFLIAARGLNLHPEECIVFEDSISGIEAANKGGFRSLGIGFSHVLVTAEHVIPNVENMNWEKLQAMYA